MIWLRIIAAFVIARLKRSLEILKESTGIYVHRKSVYRFSRDLITFPEEKFKTFHGLGHIFYFVSCFVFRMSIMQQSQIFHVTF